MRDVGARDALVVELVFPAAPGAVSRVFTVNDPRVTAAREVLMRQSGQAPTGKSGDENEMDAFHCVCASAAGAFTAYITSLFGPVAGAFRFNYTIR